MNRMRIVFIGMVFIFSFLEDSAKCQQFWWMSEYQELIQTIHKGKKVCLSTSYRVGPKGQQEVKLLLYKQTKDSLILEVKLPEKAMVSLDPKTGKTIASKDNPVITIRDHNLDGIPDDYLIEPEENFKYSGTSELTEDGFVIIRNTPEDQPILIQWNVAIGYSVNHFLHGVNSAIPIK